MKSLGPVELGFHQKDKKHNYQIPSLIFTMLNIQKNLMKVNQNTCIAFIKTMKSMMQRNIYKLDHS